MVVRYGPRPEGEVGRPGQWVLEPHTRLGLDWLGMRVRHWLGRLWFWVTFPLVLVRGVCETWARSRPR